MASWQNSVINEGRFIVKFGKELKEEIGDIDVGQTLDKIKETI